MAEVEGFYSDSYQLTDVDNGGIYTKPFEWRASWFDKRIDSDLTGKKLKAAESYEMLIRCDGVPDSVKLKIKCDYPGKMVAELIEDGAMIDSAANINANSWEEVELIPTKERALLRVKILPAIGAGKLPVGYFRDVSVKMGGSIYGLDERWDIFRLIEGGGGTTDVIISVDDLSVREWIGWQDVEIESGWLGGTIFLGAEGSEVALPELNWMAGGEGELEIQYGKKVDLVDVINGGRRAWVREKAPKRWRFGWEELSQAEMEIIKNLYEMGGEMRLKTNRDDELWRWVVIMSFEMRSKESRIASGEKKYSVELELEELIKES